MDATISISEDSNTVMNKSEPLKKTGLGERLRSAREALRLTEKEAAARLHLNVNIILLIENEDFINGPPATFMRGYLRSYARLLNLSENEITLTLKDLENTIPASVVSTPLVQLQSKQYNERYLHWLTYVIVLGLVVLVSVWWHSHSRYAIVDVPAIPAAAPPLQVTKAPSQNLPGSAQPSTGAKLAITPGPSAAALNPGALTPPAATLAPPVTSKETPEATISVTPTSQSSTVSPATKSAKKFAPSNIQVALPEPGVDNDEDENKKNN